MDDCCKQPDNKKNLPDHIEEEFLQSISTLRTTRLRQWECRQCGKLFWNGIDLDAARHNTSDGIYGITYAD